MDAHVVGKFDEAAAPVAAHGAFAAVGVVIFHFKVERRVVVQQHESVGAEAEAAVSEKFNIIGRKIRIFAFSVVEYDEVVASSLVFVKVQLHNLIQYYYKDAWHHRNGCEVLVK
jgi:hypothetical protein